MVLQGIGKYVEHLVVNVLINGALALKAVDNEFKTNLSVLEANSNVLFEELGKGLLLVPHSLLIQLLNQFMDFMVIKVEYVTIEGVEEPILRLIADLDCIQAHPVVGDSQHEADH